MPLARRNMQDAPALFSIISISALLEMCCCDMDSMLPGERVGGMISVRSLLKA